MVSYATDNSQCCERLYSLEVMKMVMVMGVFDVINTDFTLNSYYLELVNSGLNEEKIINGTFATVNLVVLPVFCIAFG